MHYHAHATSLLRARDIPVSRSQNSPPEGNGVHFMFADVSRPVFSEESEGADHFLKKGAQHAHFGPFLVHSWAKLKRLCCLT